MKKRIIAIIIAFVISISFICSLFVLTSSDGDQPYIAAQNVSNVQVTDGIENFTVNVSAGTLIGGNPTTYVTLIYPLSIAVLQALNMTFPPGTKLDCDPPPGYWNPCTPYS